MLGRRVADQFDHRGRAEDPRPPGFVFRRLLRRQGGSLFGAHFLRGRFGCGGVGLGRLAGGFQFRLQAGRFFGHLRLQAREGFFQFGLLLGGGLFRSLHGRRGLFGFRLGRGQRFVLGRRVLRGLFRRRLLFVHFLRQRGHFGLGSGRFALRRRHRVLGGRQFLLDALNRLLDLLDRVRHRPARRQFRNARRGGHLPQRVLPARRTARLRLEEESQRSRADGQNHHQNPCHDADDADFGCHKLLLCVDGYPRRIGPHAAPVVKNCRPDGP